MTATTPEEKWICSKCAGLPRQQQLSGSVTDYKGVDVSNPRYCPIPMPDGGDCWQEPEPHGFASICHDHMRKVVEAWAKDSPAILRQACPHCHKRVFARMRLQAVVYCDECGYVVKVERTETEKLTRAIPQPKNMPRPRPRIDVVYYIRFGDRIKIGTSSNLRARLSSIPCDEILAIEPGDINLERIRHAEFVSTRVHGQLEWFSITPALIEHINALRKKHGPPLGAWKRWRDAQVAA